MATAPSIFTHIRPFRLRACECVRVWPRFGWECVSKRPAAEFRFSARRERTWFTSIEINYSDFLVSWKNAAKMRAHSRKSCNDFVLRLRCAFHENSEFAFRRIFVKKKRANGENENLMPLKCMNTPLFAAGYLNSIIEFNRQSGQFNLRRTK